MDFVIERLTADADLEPILELEARSFTNPWPREMLARELAESPVSRMFVLRTPDQPAAAFCLCWVVIDELHINTVAVHPEMRRHGLATELMHYVIEDAVRCGARRATLEVRRSNTAAIRLYERLGFVVCAERTRYYSQPLEDALILWREKLVEGDGNP